MADKENEQNPNEGFKNNEPPPSEFPVTDPNVLKGIRDSVRSMEKGKALQPRFRAWGQGIDYDAVKDYYGGKPDA